MKPTNHRRLLASRIAGRTLVALSALYLVLLIPECKRPDPVGAGQRPFSWNSDSFWSSLERQFQADRVAGCADAQPSSVSCPSMAGGREVRAARTARSEGGSAGCRPEVPFAAGVWAAAPVEKRHMSTAARPA